MNQILDVMMTGLVTLFDDNGDDTGLFNKISLKIAGIITLIGVSACFIVFAFLGIKLAFDGSEDKGQQLVTNLKWMLIGMVISVGAGPIGNVLLILITKIYL